MHLFLDKTLELLRSDIHKTHMYPGWGPGMRNCFVIHYIISGRGYYKFMGKTYHLSSGDSFIITPFTTVHYYPDQKEPWVYAWIDFNGSKLYEYFKQSNWNTYPIYHNSPSDKLLPLFTILKSLDIQGSNYQEAYGLLISILGIYHDAATKAPKLESSRDKRINLALNTIHANYYHSSFNIDTLSLEVNMSHSTLYRLFLHHVGVTPIYYLQHYRIEQAEKMLLNKSTVKETALSCGYENSLYFSKAFKKIIGVSPSKYVLEKNNYTS